MYFALRPPASLLLEWVTPSDTTVALLVVDNEQFMTFESGAGTCYVGRSCPRNLARMLPLWLEPDQLLELLLGHPPVMDPATLRLERDDQRNRWLLIGDGPTDLHQELEYSANGQDLRAARSRRGAQHLFDVRYANYGRTPDGERMPRHIEINDPQSELRLTLRVLDLSALKEQPGTFDPGCPAGMVPQEVRCDEPLY